MLRIVADAALARVADTVHSAEPADGFRIVKLDSLTAIYHRRAGQTHVVAEPLPEILDALAGKQLGAAALCGLLMGDHDLPDTHETRLALTARLDELETVGLVSRA